MDIAQKASTGIGLDEERLDMSTAIRNNLKINSNSDKKTIGLSEISRELIAFIEQAPVAIALFDHNMRYLAVSRD